MARLLTGSLSLLVPGLGQLLRGRLVDAALWFVGTAWVHALLSGTAWASAGEVTPWEAALWGALAHPAERRFPLLVVLTVLAVVLHLGAAVDAHGPRTHETPDSHEGAGGS